MALSIYVNVERESWSLWVTTHTQYSLREAGDRVVIYGYVAMATTMLALGLFLHWRVSRK
jgi:hypothetical protein